MRELGSQSIGKRREADQDTRKKNNCTQRESEGAGGGSNQLTILPRKSMALNLGHEKDQGGTSKRTAEVQQNSRKKRSGYFHNRGCPREGEVTIKKGRVMLPLKKNQAINTKKK